MYCTNENFVFLLREITNKIIIEYTIRKNKYIYLCNIKK